MAEETEYDLASVQSLEPKAPHLHACVCTGKRVIAACRVVHHPSDYPGVPPPYQM
jgi:hypothetical protein